MTNIIVAFSKPEDGKNIKSILVRNGFQVVAVCTSGGQALSAADCLNGGIVVSGYRFEDMMYDELRQCLPGEFDMLLISSPARWSGQSPDRVICLPMPLKVHDLLNTLEMMPIRRIPKGLNISNKRNKANAPNAYHTCPAGAASKAISTSVILPLLPDTNS